jgi:hypothetical protein
MIAGDRVAPAALLADRGGWEFEVAACESVHFPGHTVALIATKRVR